MSESPKDPSEGTSEPTIESIAASYNLTPASSQAADPPPSPAPAPGKDPAPAAPPPDPNDTEAFNKWATGISTQNAALQKELQSTLQASREERAQLQQANEEREMNELVAQLGQQLEGVRPGLLKVALGDRYLNDQNFKAIVDNRHAAPDALKQAVGVLAGELKKELIVKADPQVAENQRALRDGAQGGAGPSDARDAQDLELANSDPGTFSNEWQKILSGR